MGLSKKDICTNISTKAHLDSVSSKKLFDFFTHIVKINLKLKSVKISNFGTFRYKKSKERIGRNPLTLEEHVIKTRFKPSFTPSIYIKKLIN